MRPTTFFLGVVLLSAGCTHPPKEAAHTTSVEPVETPAQFQARRDAAVKRQVAENLAAREQQENQEAADEQARRDALSSALIAKLQSAVRAELKDPESAKFERLHLTAAGNALCGAVNARNGFGGYTGFDPFVATGKYVLIRTKETASLFDKVQSAEGCLD